MSKPVLTQFENPLALAQKAAALWLETVSTPSDRPCLTALSGGRIARLFFEEAARQAKPGRHSLDKVEFFWADERCVPPTDRESNFALAQQCLFAPLQVPLERYASNPRGNPT